MRRLILVLVLSFPLAVTADFQAGVDAHERGDYATALRELRPLAEAGHARAQSSLGYMYNMGEGVPEDAQEAVKWYRMAAEQGLPQGQTNLGYSYEEGKGVPEDDVEATKWYRLAAEQGYSKAQFKLGFMYLHGHGVLEDYVQAYAWWNLAAAQGNKGAREAKEIFQTRMTADQVAEAQKRSRGMCAGIPGCAP